MKYNKYEQNRKQNTNINYIYLMEYNNIIYNEIFKIQYLDKPVGYLRKEQ